ncbi:MAG: CehA/McbA family metallohydrolase [Calditrichaeota bacterium]|nr:CehA/McbA family metallohydrolase [Calditrichota bacterium]
MFFFPLPVSYAETHYRFRFFFSLLKRSQPEIIADAPHRIERKNPLPVLLLIKDAHKYPVRLLSVRIFIDREKVFEQNPDIKINERLWEKIFEIPASGFNTGVRRINVKIVYEVKGKVRSCFNDNYVASSHAPLDCYFSDQKLPRTDHYYYGDLHSHSDFTDDQIEFAASLPTMKKMAAAVGLDFFCVTDHSYDLDDRIDDYLKNDPNLPKWEAFKKQCQKLNREASTPFVIPGEEVSCRNSKNQNVHLLILNDERFFPGSGDSGEKWFRYYSEYSAAEIAEKINPKAMAIPAHPAEKIPLAQKLFINRGQWRQRDLKNSAFSGLQFINGGEAEEIEKGVELWTSLLLRGQRVFPFAGNDAHGHFARTRQIGMPFISIEENKKHCFGVWKTGVKLKEPPKTPGDFIEGLKRGCLFVTDGPFLEITGWNKERRILMGAQTKAVDFVELKALSTTEFGAINTLRLIWGDFQKKREEILWQKEFDSDQSFDIKEKISLNPKLKNGYIRAVVLTQRDEQTFMALTNCIWIGQE